ncbi:MAG: DUF92 domain-containing protein [Candidatus Baltobacteraceae bacterium]
MSARARRNIAGLTPAGAVAAAAVGASALAGGSWRYAAVLLAFFLSSMLLSRAGHARKLQLTGAGKHGAARNAWQVLANGGPAAACALAALTTKSPLFATAFAGSFAAACADTWGTEIGTLLPARPVSILTLKRVAAGLSGGVTLAGTLAELAGAVFTGVVAQACGVAPWWIVAAGGFAGALADSVAGASVQELRYCDHCKRACETNPHACGSATHLIRGASRFGNDAVNLVCTVTGAGGAAAIAAAFR